MSDGSPENRRGKRDSLLLMTEFRTPEGRSIGQARIRNLSLTGLMAEIAAPLPVGGIVAFDLRGVGPVTAEVMWARSGRVGLRFSAPVDPQAVRRPTSAVPQPKGAWPAEAPHHLLKRYRQD